MARLLGYGDRAVLVEVSRASEVGALVAALRDADPVGVVAVVPAARTVLVEYDPDVLDRTAVDRLIRQAATRPTVAPSADRPTVRIPVRYDGADLQSVADAVGLSVPDVIDRHLAGDYSVQFCGFSPGFSYLTGLDPLLRLARLDSPRTVVPAGSVAVAGEFTGIYPRTSPGGWRLLGRTEAVLFDVERRPPALLLPGMNVRFVRA
jgi:KipI family sensor histidine kinase inhibitor